MIRIHKNHSNWFCKPSLQKENFVKYMMNVSEVKARHLLNVEITRLQMKWRTTNNSIDCGIFAMRHMETYKGNGVRSWDSKFAPETQKVNMDTFAYVPNLSHSPNTLSF